MRSRSHLSVVKAVEEGEGGTGLDVAATVARLSAHIPLVVKAGFAAEVKDGYVMTKEGALAAAVLIGLGILDAGREGVDVEGTSDLVAYLVGEKVGRGEGS